MKIDRLIEKNETQMHKFDCIPINKDFIPDTVTIERIKYPKFLELSSNGFINFECLNRSKTIKKIFFWSKIYGKEAGGYGIGAINPFIKNRCPVTNCETIVDLKRINESDLVVVHFWKYDFDQNVDELVKYRSSNQRWVYQLIEPPAILDNEFPNISQYNGFFNLSISYKLDADFKGAYSRLPNFIWKLNEQFKPDFDFFKGKEKLAFAVISNCGAFSRRFDYLVELKKYADVDIFGKCGKPCPIANDQCKSYLFAKYKFYMAFENSLCKDYITEKFFTAIINNIVPVVFGLGNYENHIPKSGFINALDFKTIKELGEYLNYVANNQTVYNSFFKWKKYISPSPFNNTILKDVCNMCVQLQLETFTGIENKVIENLEKFSSFKSNCKKPLGNNFTYFNLI